MKNDQQNEERQTTTKVTTFIKGSRVPRETLLRHDQILEKRKKAAASQSEVKDESAKKEEEEKKDGAQKGNEENGKADGEEEGEEEMEEEMEEDSLIADRITENSYIYLIEQETFAHVKSKIDADTYECIIKKPSKDSSGPPSPTTLYLKPEASPNDPK